MMRGAGREVNNHCKFMFFRHWLSQWQRKSSDWIGGEGRAQTKTKAFPAFEVTVRFAKLQLFILDTPQWADTKCEADILSRDGSTPPETEKLMSSLPAAERSSCHQERSSVRLNKRAHNTDPISNREPETITTLIKAEKTRWQRNPQHLMAATRPKRQGSLTEPGGIGEDEGGETERRSSFKAKNLPPHRRSRNLKTLYIHTLDQRARGWHTTETRPPSMPSWSEIK